MLLRFNDGLLFVFYDWETGYKTFRCDFNTIVSL